MGKKSLICQEAPCWETIFSSVPSGNFICLGTLKGFLSWHSSHRGPSNLLFTLLLDLHKDTVRCQERKSKDLAENNWSEPWLPVCKKDTCFHWSKRPGRYFKQCNGRHTWHSHGPEIEHENFAESLHRSPRKVNEKKCREKCVPISSFSANICK